MPYESYNHRHIFISNITMKMHSGVKLMQHRDIYKRDCKLIHGHKTTSANENSEHVQLIPAYATNGKV